MKSFKEFLTDKGLGDEKGMTMDPQEPNVLTPDNELFDSLKELIIRIAANKDAYRDFMQFIAPRKEYDHAINNLVDMLPKESSASLRQAARKSLNRKKVEDMPKVPHEEPEIIPNAADSAPNPYGS
jgi:uncharacterized protein with von Willebrand factor type A (vWA) domain